MPISVEISTDCGRWFKLNQADFFMKVKVVHEAIVRAGSGAYTPSKGTVKAGEILTATMQIDGWSYVPALEGWINNYHLEKV